jgi:hypothetical protein
MGQHTSPAAFSLEVSDEKLKTAVIFLQVRYSQLRKAQEKLIGDLENCVSRRDTIMDQAEARKQRAHKGSNGTQKKSEDIHNKIKRVKSVGTFVIHETGCGQFIIIIIIIIIILQYFDWLATFHLDLLQAILFIAV